MKLPFPCLNSQWGFLKLQKEFECAQLCTLAALSSATCVRLEFERNICAAKRAEQAAYSLINTRDRLVNFETLLKSFSGNSVHLEVLYEIAWDYLNFGRNFDNQSG